MARTPRRIISGKIYEICCRARQGLPLPPNRTINTIIRGIIARTQRDDKVTVCHFTWMSNHPHFIVKAKDSEQCIKFYMEIERKITEAIKRLLGLEILHLWEGTPMVALLPDIDTIKERIAYIYANPSEADLEVSIDLFPGLSSWKEFKNAQSEIDAKFISSEAWIRPKVLVQLPSATLSRHQDSFFSNKFITACKKSHDLVIEPNAWMPCFNIEDPKEVVAINNSITENLFERQRKSEQRRASSNKRVVGAHRLALEPIMKTHRPKKKSKKIFVICVDKNLRISCIQEHKYFCQERKERYLQWKLGDFSSPWPPGAFRPPMPPLANAISH